MTKCKTLTGSALKGLRNEGILCWIQTFHTYINDRLLSETRIYSRHHIIFIYSRSEKLLKHYALIVGYFY